MISVLQVERLRSVAEVSLIFFYAPWCAHSMAARQEVQQVARKLAKQVLVTGHWSLMPSCKHLVDVLVVDEKLMRHTWLSTITNPPLPVCCVCVFLFAFVCVSHKHRCSLWPSTVGTVWGSAGGKIAFTTIPSSTCFIESKWKKTNNSIHCWSTCDRALILNCVILTWTEQEVNKINNY